MSKRRSNMKIRQCFVLTIILLGFQANVLGFPFQYYEHDDLDIPSDINLSGSHAVVGDFPHWCLGNVRKCQNGFSIKFSIKMLHDNVDTSEVVIFTNGGSSFSSEGLYLVKKLGDQYEAGVTKGNQKWRVNFRFVPRQVVKFLMTWDETDGLKMRVDDQEYKQNTPEICDNDEDVFDTYSHFTIGSNMYGEPLQEAVFEMGEMAFYDKVLENYVDDSYSLQGCVRSIQATAETLQVNSTDTHDIVQHCRTVCSSDHVTRRPVIKNFVCYCVDVHDVDILTTANESCARDMYEVYRTSFCTRENPYTIDVKVHLLSNKSYVKAYDSVRIEIISNLPAFTTFTVDVGDGVKITTLDRTIYHYWYQTGEFTITVTAKLGTIDVTGHTTFLVEDVDEGIAPEMVYITGYHSVENQKGMFDVYFASNYSTICSIDFGDSTDNVEVRSGNKFVGKHSLEHSFQLLGLYKPVIGCKNNYGNKTTRTVFASKTFDLLFDYFKIGSNFSTQYAPGFSYLDTTDILRNAKDSLGFVDTNALISFPLKRPFENLVSFDIGDETVQKRIFYVQSNLSEAEIIIDNKADAWMLTTNISVLIPPGYHTFVNCTFGLSVDEMFYVYSADSVVHVEFLLNYTKIGYYDVVISTSNDISETSVADLISVEVPIDTIDISTENIIDKTDPVVLNVSLNMDNDGPQKVRFEIDHGDGHTRTYHYFSSTELFSTYQNNYVYKDWGVYKICVTAMNEISNVTACVKVQVGQNMTYNDIQTDTDARVSTRKYASVILTSTSGSDRTYVVDFGDGRPFTFTDQQLDEGVVETLDMIDDETSLNNNTTQRESNSSSMLSTTGSVLLMTTDPPSRKKRNVVSNMPRSIANRTSHETIEVLHIYEKPGQYRVSMTVQNEFSEETKNLCPSIIVDDTDISSCDTPNVWFDGIDLSQPYERIRSKQIDIIVNATSACSHDFTYSWKMTRLLNGYYKTFGSICENIGTKGILTIPEVFLGFGNYKITIIVAPVGYPLAATSKVLNLKIIPSPPVAYIAGDDEMWFLTFGTTTIDFQQSRDPDLILNKRKGIEYDLFCMPDNAYSAIKKDDLATLRGKSKFILEDTLFGGKTKNPARFYDYATCLDPDGLTNATAEISLSGGLFNMPSRFFSSEFPKKTFVLYVTKEGRTTKAHRTIELRVSNSTDAFSELDALLAKKDVAGVLAAVNILSSGVDGGGNSTAAQEEAEQMKEALVNYVEAVSDKVQNVGQCKMAASAVTALTEGEISMKTRSKGSNAIAKTSASMSTKFAEEPMSTLTNVAEVGLKGISNVLPKQVESTEEKAKKRTKRQLNVENIDVKVDHCKVETKVPETVNGETEQEEEELDDYDSLVKRFDLLTSKELETFYDCLYENPKAFRGAVRKYGTKMWFPMSTLDIENDELFGKYGMEWEPFDVDEFINDFCRLEQRRLHRERLEADENVAMASMGAIGDVSNLMLGKMEATRRRRKRREAIGNGTLIPDPDEEEDEGEDVDQSLTISADNVAVQMQNIDPDADGEQSMGTDAGGAKMDPSLFGSMGSEGGCSVGATVTVNQDNPFTFGNGTGSKVGTRVVSIDLSNPCTGQKALVQNTTKPIVVEMDGNPDKIDCPMEFILCLSRKTSGEDPREFNYHPVQVDTNDSTIHFTIWPDREGDRFQVFIKYEDYPNATWYDHTAIIPHRPDAFSHISADQYPEKRRYLQHTYFPPQHLTKLNGTYRIAVKLHEKTNVNFGETKVCLNYSTQLMISGCKFWSEEDQMYKSDGLVVSNDTTIWKTICMSTHLTSFGGDFAVPPNTIDFSNVWAKFDPVSNPAVFSTVIALIGLYIILVIWARKMDKKDLLKWGATPLEDNLPTDNYHYQITVQTGMRKKAGTTSKISFVLSGESHDSGARRLYDGHRKTLNEGSILNYILSVEQSLGPLSFLRIWHDNSGKGKFKSWYLDQLQISDLQTGERYFFLCDRWLAVEEGDGLVDRIIPVAGREDLAAFKHLFTSSIRKKLTSDHLWFSVFSRPTRSSFTRVQRISCCMSLLFMTMITNAMWFKSDDRANQTNALQIGPVSFTLQQVFVSFASTMLVFPVNFIIITFFRRCRPKKNAVVQMHQQAPKKGKWKNVTSSSQIWGNAPKRSRWRKFTDAMTNITNFHQRSKYGADDIEEEDDKPKPKIVGLPEEKQAKKKKKPGTLPHWCIYIAYVLTGLSIVVPGFFTILYSMEWGPEKANEWLTTFLMSFFQSVIVVQPVKVMCLVAFIACVLKKPDLDEEDGASEDINNVIAAHDEEMLHKGHEELDAIVEKRKRANEECQPMDMETLNRTREARMMEIKMETVVREIAIYLMFVLILFFLSYQQRDSFSFQMASNLKNYFDNGFSSITTTEQYWNWMETKLIPAMYATHYHNDTEIKRWWDKRCVADMESRRVGIPRLRQLRVKPDTCTVNQRLKKLISHCRDEYGWTDDDAKDYFPGWIKPDDEGNYTYDMLEDAKTPWVYRTSMELANAPYVGSISTYKGGGYVAQFKLNVDRTKEMLAELRKNVWIDIHTRGLFLEFTVYNPNVNLFGSMIMLVEFMQSGGAVTRTEFKIFRLLSYIGGMGILVILFEVLYSCFTLYFFVHFVKKLKKEGKKYFKSFWNKLEFVLMVFCVTVIAMYALKHILTSVAMDALKDRERAGNVNFQSLAQYDELYSYMVGIVVFLATIQFLKLLQFNKKMNMLGDTVSLAAKDLKVFSFAFIIYFLAFTMFGFLLFGTTLYPFSGFITAAESMFAFTLGSFDFAAMEASQKILGPIFFFLFIFIVYVGLMSIFLTIIADAFNTVKENVATQTNDYEIVDFIWKKIKGVIG